MKEIKLSTEVKVIQTKEIDTLEFRLIYPIKHHNDNNSYLKLLDLIISTSSKAYPEYTDFKKEGLKRMLLNFSFSQRRIVDNTYLIISFSMPKVGLLKEFKIDKTFKFVADAILRPYVDKKGFNKEKFLKEKEFVYSNYLKSNDGIYGSNSNQFYDLIDPEEEISHSYEKSGQVIQSITEASLYDFYKKNILDNNFIPYVYGDISYEQANKLFSKYLPQEKKDIIIKANYFKKMPMKEPMYKEFITDFNQSELILEYQVNMTERERKYLSTLINILQGPENNLIFEALRVQHNLVYDTKVVSFSRRAMFLVVAFIPSDKCRLTKKYVKDVFEKLKDEQFLTVCLNKLVKGIEVDILKEEDGLGKSLNDKIDHDLKLSTTEEALAEVKSIKVSELIRFINKIELTNEVFFRGVERC